MNTPEVLLMATNVHPPVHRPPPSNGQEPAGTGDLTRFIVPEPPLTGRGRRNVWPERFAAMIEQCPGQWIDATAAWGLKKSTRTVAMRHAEALELNVEARTHEGRLFLRIR